MVLTNEQLLHCYDIVFSTTHSDGFKTAEMHDLLFEDGYRFMERPNVNWKHELRTYLVSIQADFSTMHIFDVE